MMPGIYATLESKMADREKRSNFNLPIVFVQQFLFSNPTEYNASG